MLYTRPVSSLGADPFVERLRDALGTVRSAYAASEDAAARAALKKAGEDVKAAIDVATSRRREKELGGRLREARRSLLRAAEAAPWASPGLLGAVARLPRMRGYG